MTLFRVFNPVGWALAHAVSIIHEQTFSRIHLGYHAKTGQDKYPLEYIDGMSTTANLISVQQAHA
jgi:hypothetical protein